MRPLRVLILDRDTEHSLGLQRELEAAGHRADRVVELVTCIALARVESCSVVLVGSTIANGSSFALPLALSGPRPWLVYMTRLHHHGLGRTARAVGFDDVLVKAVTAEELLRCVARLERRNGSASIDESARDRTTELT